MNQNKRQRVASKEKRDPSKKEKLECSSLDTIKKSAITSSTTCLENLSNELIYEIFEHLNINDIFECFFDLNLRFHDLCLQSNLSIKINSSFLSKTRFDLCYTHLIMHKKHRIQSLHLCDAFIIDYFCSSTQDFTAYTQLQTIVVNQINPSHLDNLLIQAASLPCLSSLAISIQRSTNIDTVWMSIMKLPALKHLMMTIKDKLHFYSPLKTVTIRSSIEHLVINGEIDYYDVDSVLSYLPHLHRLAINHMSIRYRYLTYPFTTILSGLTHVFLHLTGVTFDQFESFAKACFGLVKVLRITSNDDATYLDADRWQKLIENHMSYLQIFDIQYKYAAYTIRKRECLKQHLLNAFESQFWFERKWFFTHEINYEGSSHGIVYSTKPYTRKSFTIADESDSTANIQHEKTPFPTVERVMIYDEKQIEYCSKYFPNATELTVSDQRIDRSRRSANISIAHIVPLNQLTKLTIVYSYRPFSKVIELLSSTPNVHTLVFKSITIVATDYSDLQQTKQFQLVTSQNKIKALTVSFTYSFRTIQLFVNLCPRLQHISMGTTETPLEQIIRFLLGQTKKTTCCLSSITISDVNPAISDKLKAIIELEHLLDNLAIKTIGKDCFLWW
ncbi:unnamed protein product [Adineta ricciae]|uniref:F-box domain-containing protein n=1 Tax=Adineta ricciae TaxID=249248 RepID=A0A816FAC7_ADIRI|nr:unnamed protein product [Adineta ricciae]